MEETSAVLLVIGSTVFGIGASLGVPSVFNTSDREVRRELLARHRTRWQIAQPLYALGNLPGRPFATYVWLTLGGLALLGLALLTAGYPGWLGWLVVGADVAFLGMYLTLHDIPPFVFYVLLTFVGVAVLVA